MGNILPNLSSGIAYKLHPDVTPRPDVVSKFDPLDGFADGRTAKVMQATPEELYSAKVPLKNRDYCAHTLLKFYQCRRQEFPVLSNCHHQRHAYLHCEYEEYVDRMKDYEREKRMLQREKNLARGA